MRSLRQPHAFTILLYATIRTQESYVLTKQIKDLLITFFIFYHELLLSNALLLSTMR